MGIVHRRPGLNRFAVALALAVALPLAAAHFPASAQAPVVVRIGNALEPSAVTIPAGTTVRWENADSIRHRMRSTSGPAEFDGDMDPGASFSFTFTLAGTYQYRDERDRTLSNYWGVITVTSGTTPGSGATPPAGGTPPSGAAEVSMAGRAFTPSTLTIAAGSVVTFRNNDGREHTVTARDGSFDSGVVAVGAVFQKTFTAGGNFAYFCAIHPDMTGTISVEGAPGAPPPAPTPAPTPRPASAAANVSIIDFGFSPVDFAIPVGGTVTWVNNGVALHTVTSEDGSFDSGYLTAGQPFSRTFAGAGTFRYLCSLHSNMSGSIVVGGAPGAPPPPVATAPSRPTPLSDVRAIEFAFEPAQLRVDVGATVTWANGGVAPHTVTARDGSFDSGTLRPGAAFSWKFDRPGTFQYLCALHPDMTGTVVVPDATGVAPPPQAPPPRASAVRVAPPPGVPEIADVDVVDFGFSPSSVQIAVGGSVRWVNSGVAPHTVTAPDGSFDSGFLNRGEQFTRAFTTEGTFSYLCTLHPGMTGAVVVSREAPTATSRPSAQGGPPAQPADRGGGAPAASGRVNAEMRDFSFEPAHITVQPGATVVWTNTGVAPHTVSARDGSFGSGIKNSGESFEQRFDAAGVWEYFCAVHPAMLGTVEVVAPGTAASQGDAGGASGAESRESRGVSALVFVLGIAFALGVGAVAMYLALMRPALIRRAGK